MATQTMTSRKNATAEDFAGKLRSIGLGENAISSPNDGVQPVYPAYMNDQGVGGSPYPHAGILAGLLGSQARQFYSEFNVDPDDSAITGDVDDDGAKLLHTNDLEVDLGFRPTFLIWGQQNGALTSEIFIKMRGLDFTAVKDHALRMLLDADMSGAADIAFVASRIRLNNIAENDTNVVTLLAGSIVDNIKHFLIAFG